MNKVRAIPVERWAISPRDDSLNPSSCSCAPTRPRRRTSRTPPRARPPPRSTPSSASNRPRRSPSRPSRAWALPPSSTPSSTASRPRPAPSTDGSAGSSLTRSTTGSGASSAWSPSRRARSERVRAPSPSPHSSIPLLLPALRTSLLTLSLKLCAYWPPSGRRQDCERAHGQEVRGARCRHPPPGRGERPPPRRRPGRLRRSVPSYFSPFLPPSRDRRWRADQERVGGEQCAT